MLAADLATRQRLRLRADPSRVITRLFVPGRPDPGSGRRVGDAVAHVLGLDDDEVDRGLHELQNRFGGRHRDLSATFEHHADRLADRIPAGRPLSPGRRLLLGAAFTHEYSIEAAALCNPSLVVAPHQATEQPGSVDLVMSTRGIGEGHCSSIGFRRVTVDERGQVSVAPPAPFATTGTISGATLRADALRGSSSRVDDDAESTAWVLDGLPPSFSRAVLDARLGELEGHADTRPHVERTVRRLRALADRAYRVEFDPSCPLEERVLHPVTEAERNGVEDARFVRFEDEDGARYYATYTAYDGERIAQQLLATSDFRTFETAPLRGPSAGNKGLALFPRRIGGRFAALTRHDGATNGVAFTDDVRRWPPSSPLAERTTLRSSIQVGNCGSPIETEAGWIALTHGVGPMRTYTISALLLDLDDPRQVIGELPRPLLSPLPGEQDGYVPNVVYSCGAVRHGPRLVIPFGIGDASIGFATVTVDDLLDHMTPP